MKALNKPIWCNTNWIYYPRACFNFLLHQIQFAAANCVKADLAGLLAVFQEHKQNIFIFRKLMSLKRSKLCWLVYTVWCIIIESKRVKLRK